MKETVTSILEEVANDFCDNFCKYGENMQGMTDEACDEMMDAICEKKCPLNRIL